MESLFFLRLEQHKERPFTQNRTFSGSLLMMASPCRSISEVSQYQPQFDQELFLEHNASQRVRSDQQGIW